MKRLPVIIFLLISVTGYSLNEEMLREWKTTTWRLNITLKTHFVQGGAVQFAIMDHDPRKSFSRAYEKLKKKMQEENKYNSDSETSILTVAWDKQFADVKGDELYILFKNNMCEFSSNSKEKQYYLVTKTSMIKDKPSAWVIPVNVKIGSEQDVTLNDSNVIDLKKIAE